MSTEVQNSAAFGQDNLVGAYSLTALNAQFPPATFVAGHILRLRNVAQIFVRAVTAAGVAVWVPLAGTAAATWGNYVVSNDPDVPAPYATIQAAIDQAVLDGHGGTGDITGVIVYAGRYVGDVVLRAGISVIALSLGAVSLTGRISLFDEDGSFVMSGFHLLNGHPAVDVVLDATTHDIEVTLLDCDIENTLIDEAVIFSNTSTKSKLNLVRTTIRAVNAGPFGAALVQSSTGTRMVLRECAITVDDGARVAMDALGKVKLEDCEITGQVQLRTSAVLDMVGGSITTTGQNAITLFSSFQPNQARNVLIRHGGPGATIFAVGPSSLGLTDCYFPSGRLFGGTAPGDLDLQFASFTAKVHTINASPLVANTVLDGDTMQDLVTVDTTIGLLDFTLPQTVTMPHGQRIKFLNVSNVANVARVLPGGPDTMNAGLSPFVSLIGLEFAEFQADRNARTWYRIG